MLTFYDKTLKQAEQCKYVFDCLNPLTPGRFAKNVFLDILVVFRLDIGQISFNLVKKAFAIKKFALLPTSIAFYDVLEIKNLRYSFGGEKIFFI